MTIYHYFFLYDTESYLIVMAFEENEDFYFSSVNRFGATKQ